MTQPTSTTGCCSASKAQCPKPSCTSSAPGCSGGILSKARRGELRMPLPVGLVYDPAGQRRARPRQRASSDALAAPVRHVRADRLGARGRVGVQPRRAAVPQADPQRPAQGRARMDRADALARAAHAAQPALCRRVRLWPAHAPARHANGKTTTARRAARAMDRADPRRPPRLSSPWSSTSRTQRHSPPTPRATAPTAPAARPAKAPRCCKASSSADAAAAG